MREERRAWWSARLARAVQEPWQAGAVQEPWQELCQQVAYYYYYYSLTLDSNERPAHSYTLSADRSLFLFLRKWFIY